MPQQMASIDFPTQVFCIGDVGRHETLQLKASGQQHDTEEWTPGLKMQIFI